MTALVVYRDTTRVGRLDRSANDDVQFTYDAGVTAAVGLCLPVRAKPYTGPLVLAVFENLLPEGALRDALGTATKHDVRDTVGLLGAVGGECAGALQLWPEGTAPVLPPRYEPLTASALRSAFLSADGQLRQVTGRASLSGAQAKLALWRMPPVNGEHPKYQLPVDGAPTTVVVKRPGAQFAGLLEAELVGMRLMEAAGVPTASSARCAVAPTCHESERFDRVVTADGAVHRRHAEDGCQLTGRLSRQKYAGQGGPTYQELVAVLNRNSVDPLTDREMLFRWAVANAAMGNHDAHAKNVSVVYETTDLVRLAPAYDVVVTALFPELDQTLALSFGGTTQPAALNAHSLKVAAREFRFTPARARDLADDVCTRVAGALDAVLHDVAKSDGDEAVLARLRTTVQGTLAAVKKCVM